MSPGRRDLGFIFLEMLFKYDEVQIVAERCPEAIVIVRKGLCFTGKEVATPQVPRDQCFAQIYNCHANEAGAAPFCKFLGCG